MDIKIKDSDPSILYRCNQKYFDKALSKYGLGYSNLIFLLEIYENEGVSLNELAKQGAFDKGTITKSIQKLEQLDYVVIKVNNEDKRGRLLYTSDKANTIIPSLYLLKNEWDEYLSKEISKEEINSYFNTLSKLINKARLYSNHEENEEIKIYEFNKLSLTDYKDNVSSVVYTGGCNFKCPYCNKKNLIFLSPENSEIDLEEIYAYLDKRKDILDAITISGGEPLIQKGLIEFVKSLKERGYLVKLNTNGSDYELLKNLIDNKLIDYVTLDIKNDKNNYAKTIGLDNYDISDIEKCLNYLKKSKLDYEINITLVKEYFMDTDFGLLGAWLKGVKKLVLTNFVDNGNVLKAGLHGFGKDKLIDIKNVLSLYVDDVIIKE